MKNIEKSVTIIVFIAFFIVVAYGIYDWAQNDHINGAAILTSFIILSYLINWMNWGNHNGGSPKNEAEQQVVAKSAKVSYYVLMVLAATILFISEGVTNIIDIENIPLLIVVGLTFVVLPITEFIYMKKLKNNR